MINRISNPIINNRMILFPKSTGFMRLFEISQWNLYQITVLSHVLYTYASLLGMQFIQHYKHISKCIAKFTATSEKCFQYFPVHLGKLLVIQQLHVQNRLTITPQLGRQVQVYGNILRNMEHVFLLVITVKKERMILHSSTLHDF